MSKAYVMMNCELGEEKTAIEAIKKIELYNWDKLK